MTNRDQKSYARYRPAGLSLAFLVSLMLAGCSILPGTPTSRQGVLDARAVEPSRAVYLEGTWDWWPDSLVTPEAAGTAAGRTSFSDRLAVADLIAPDQYRDTPAATYRMRFIPQTGLPGPLSLRMPALGAYRGVWVNGKRVDTTTVTPVAPAGTSASGPIDVVLQVAGDSLPPPAAITAGTTGVLVGNEIVSILLTLLPACFLLMLAGCWVIYAFTTNRGDRSVLLLVILYGALTVRFALLNVPLTYLLWPALPFGFYDRLTALSFTVGLVALLAYLRGAGALRPRVADVLVLATCALVIPLAVAGPWYRAAASLTMALTAALILAVTVIGIIRRRERGKMAFSAPFLAGMVVLLALIVGDILAGRTALFTVYGRPAGMFAFGIFQVALLVRFSLGSARSVEYLSEYADTVTRSVKRFIPEEFLSYLNKADIVDLKLGDHVEKNMTIFFSDIRAFTQLSETLTTEENFRFINSYLSRVVPVVTEHSGFIDKYVGDGIMALYPDERGADSAVQSAIAIQQKIVEYNADRAKAGYRALSMGIGIHTGKLMLGVVGVTDRMEGTVISDAVNLASRLESITKAFNISMAISEQTFKSLEDPGSYKYRFIGKVKVKGKREPVSVFEIFDGIRPETFELKMKANMFFEQAMINYYQKDFHEAVYYFKKTLEILPDDGAAMFYLKHCLNKA